MQKLTILACELICGLSITIMIKSGIINIILKNLTAKTYISYFAPHFLFLDGFTYISDISKQHLFTWRTETFGTRDSTVWFSRSAEFHNITNKNPAFGATFSHVLSQSSTWWCGHLFRRFCNMLSESSLVCLGSMAAAVQPNSLGTLGKPLQNLQNKWPPHL